MLVESSELPISTLRSLYHGQLSPCAACFAESGWAQVSGVESSNVTLRIGWLPICHYAPAIFLMLSVEYAEQMRALWLYAVVECWRWTTSMKSGVDLQPTSCYGGALPAILTGLHEVWAWCQKFPVMALAGRCSADFPASNKKPYVLSKLDLEEGGSSWTGLLLGSSSPLPPWLTAHHMSCQTAAEFATWAPRGAWCVSDSAKFIR